jgi:D-amino-acid oxidase
VLLAHHLPGDLALTYASPWAGANWLSVATDGGRAEARDAVTYVKFGELADGKPEAGVRRMPIRAMFDKEREEAGVLSPDGKVWYEELVGGLREVKELPEGVKFGYELDTFVVDVTTYLPW